MEDEVGGLKAFTWYISAIYTCTLDRSSFLEGSLLHGTVHRA